MSCCLGTLECILGTKHAQVSHLSDRKRLESLKPFATGQDPVIPQSLVYSVGVCAHGTAQRPRRGFHVDVVSSRCLPELMCVR